LRLGPAGGAQLLMPRLGEPVEPAHGKDVEPWWRTERPERGHPLRDTLTAAALPTSISVPMD
jgi:hypothetical protein